MSAILPVFLDSRSNRQRKLWSLKNIRNLIIFLGILAYTYSLWISTLAVEDAYGNTETETKLENLVTPKVPPTNLDSERMIQDNTIKRVSNEKKKISPSPQLSPVASLEEQSQDDMEEKVIGSSLKIKKYITIIYSFDDRDRDNEAKVEISSH